MAEAAAQPGSPTTGYQIEGGSSLKVQLRRANRRLRVNAFLLTAPLLLFLLASFIVPIGMMLFRAVHDPIVGEALPRTVEALADWDRQDLPDEAAFAAVVEDLRALRDGGTDGRAMVGRLATRLNFEEAGVRSAITGTARKVDSMEPPYKEALIDADREWGKRDIWATIQRLGPDYTTVHFLASLDLRYTTDGDIAPQPEERQVYVSIWLRTLMISLTVTLACVALGYPVAYLLATLPLRYSNLLMILVLLPFWTSLLVRTTSWIVVLGQNGVLLETLAFLSDGLEWLGLPEIIGDEGRPRLIYNLTGSIVAMTHILLPFMILPLYSVMRGISPSYMRAAQNLGATPARAFLRVYLPQTVPGLGAGCILVFILAIGYYITPAIVGGEDGTMISNFIAHHMQKSLNWGFAAALGSLLLAAVMVLYWVYDRIVGINNMKLG
ncbi:MAG: ABC transporter permease [Kiloniellaceae bacterium]